MSVYIGIDLGTTQSVVSAVIKNPITGDITEKTLEIPQVNMNGDYEYPLHLPSVVCFEDDSPVVGLKANAMMSEHKVSFVKNHMGTEWSMEVGGETWDAPKISALYLKRLLEVVYDEFPHFKLNEGLTVSIPASFTLAMKEDTIKACQLAGIEIDHLHMVHEPIAAALTLVQTLERDAQGNRFIREGLLNGQDGSCRLLVFDIGGGTLDVALLTLKEEIIEGNYRIRPTTEEISPHTLLGGYAFDEELADYVTSRLKLEGALYEQLYPRILKDIEQQKKKLSNRRNERQTEDVSFTYRLPRVMGHGHDVPERLPLSYADMKEAWRELLQPGVRLSHVRDLSKEGAVLNNPKSILEPIASIFEKLGGQISPDQVQAILPVGGMSSVALIPERLQELFPQAIIVQPDGVQPSLAIARGAAYHQYQLKERKGLLRNLLPHVQIQVNREGQIEWCDLIPQGERIAQDERFSKRTSGLRFPKTSDNMYIPVRLNGQDRGVAIIVRPVGSQGDSFEFSLTLTLQGESLIPVFEISSYYGRKMEFSIAELQEMPQLEVSEEGGNSPALKEISDELRNHWNAKLNPKSRTEACARVSQISSEVDYVVRKFSPQQHEVITRLKTVKDSIRSSVMIDKPAPFLISYESQQLLAAKEHLFDLITRKVMSSLYFPTQLESYLYLLLGSFKQLLTDEQREWLFARLETPNVSKNARTELLMALGRSISTPDEWLRLSVFAGKFKGDAHLEAHVIWGLSRSLLHLKTEELTPHHKVKIEAMLTKLTRPMSGINSVYYHNLYPLYIIAYLIFKPLWADFMDSALHQNQIQQLGRLPMITIKQLSHDSVWNMIIELYSGKMSTMSLRELLPMMSSKLD